MTLIAEDHHKNLNKYRLTLSAAKKASDSKTAADHDTAVQGDRLWRDY